MIKLKSIQQSEKEPNEIKMIREYEHPTSQLVHAQKLIKEVYDKMPQDAKVHLNVLYTGTKGNKKTFWKILQDKSGRK